MDGFHPANILADPATWRTTAVADLELTNAMPAQYAHDVPSWLLLRGLPIRLYPEMDEFEALFARRMDDFVAAMRRAEAAIPDGSHPSLAAKVGESWATGRFWFNLAMRSAAPWTPRPYTSVTWAAPRCRATECPERLSSWSPGS